VRDDSVRLLIGSSTQTNRVNGRLDGDTLELTIPQEQGMLTRRLKSAREGDYTKAVQGIRDHEQQRKAAASAARARKQRADRIAITRVASMFQKALDPDSSDDPCRASRPTSKSASAVSATRPQARRARQRSVAATPRLRSLWLERRSVSRA